MAKRFYIIRDGEKLFRDTLQSISSLARKEANRIGEDVWVHTHEERTGRNSRAVRQPAGQAFHMARNPAKKATYSRNPDPMIAVDHAWNMHKARTGVAAARAKEAATKYTVYATSRRDQYKLTRKGKAAADKLANEFREAGYQVEVMAANPAKRAAARKRDPGRGYFVEYQDGAKLARIPYKNKGIATIRAKAMKRDGWRKVRVLSA